LSVAAENVVNEFILEVEGKAEGKQRPRHNPFVQKRPFTPKKTVTAEREIRAAWEAIGKPRFPDVAIGLEIFIGVSRPQSHFKRNGELSAEGKRHPYPDNKKPDLDNAAKTVLDALNSRAWRDDVRVTRLLLDRDWTDWPYTRIHASVRPLREWGADHPSYDEMGQ
jgi:Holliday junction resolvase RusA-like endonuclease